MAEMRTFDSGATRNPDGEKYDYEGFLSPLVLEAYGRYMHAHRRQADGTLRGSDNWQRGIPPDQYLKSAIRHVMDWWKIHREYPCLDRETGQVVDLVDALCGVIFNAMGYLHERLKVEVPI